MVNARPRSCVTTRYAHAIASNTTAEGTASSIHSAKFTAEGPVSKPAAIALGGVPMTVPMPPRFAAKATPSASAFDTPSPGSRDANSGVIIAKTSVAVAVFETNIDSTAVTTMTPISSMAGR